MYYINKYNSHILLYISINIFLIFINFHFELQSVRSVLICSTKKMSTHIQGIKKSNQNINLIFIDINVIMFILI